MGEEGFKEFTNKLLKRGSNKHRNTNSYGIREAHLFYTANRPQKDKFILSKATYSKIISRVNSLLVDMLLQGHDIILPHRMGKIEIRRVEDKVTLVDGKIVTNRSVDWVTTHKYWYDNPTARESKQLIYFMDTTPKLSLRYSKGSAYYTNKNFFGIRWNRALRKRLAVKAKARLLDGFKTN